jgi:hypothetical protein
LEALVKTRFLNGEKLAKFASAVGTDNQLAEKRLILVDK